MIPIREEQDARGRGVRQAMNFEGLLDLLADNQREREKLSELLAWISEDKASEVLTRAHFHAASGILLKRAVQNEVIGLTLRHSSEFGYV